MNPTPQTPTALPQRSRTGAYRIYAEKKPRFRVEAESLRAELNENIGLDIRELRLINVYDLFGFSPELLEKCRYAVFGEAVTDTVTDSVDFGGHRYLAVEYLPGQFDQRASSAVDCVHLIEPDAAVEIRSARLLVFDGSVGEQELAAIRHYYINGVECREKDLERLGLGEQAAVRPLEDLSGFTQMEEADYEDFRRRHGLAMSNADLAEVLRYFRSEQRDPTETELRILDTYWSDHCRHTTFTTRLTSICVDDSFLRSEIEGELAAFHAIREELGRSGKPLCLMELATIGARVLRKRGLLDDLEVSEENNACSIYIDVDVDGQQEQWLLQFKNETHNHPTEIEPFGGAATCLGGAIRDPLSGRAYVYQAMRVTGAGDIFAPASATLPGKLPQRVISRKAAAGYSSYGNQIGLATTHVREIYDPGYTAKRMEVGAVVGAVKAENVRRESPAPGDIILLLGGRTGRDGIGGATGSSKQHTEASLESCGSEVQKGNAPEERKLQHLFRRSELTRLIKKSNDFGAGGVSVAIGELAPGLDIWLDRVPVKYSGLNATELAISESQERMAVVIDPADRAAFEALCAEENIEVTHVADVTGSARMRLYFHGEKVADLSREFIDSAGAPHYAEALIAPVEDRDPFLRQPVGNDLKERVLRTLSEPNVASQKGLIEMFDASIGRSTVLMPYGGLFQTTETQVSVQKLPVDGYTDTASLMCFGYHPAIARWSPYHGAAYAVVEAVTKAVAAGAEWSRMRFSYQEYFERMSADPRSWGKPLAALLGALKMQTALGLPSIGGKDSMSGSFEALNVPPTLIAFGVGTLDASAVVSPEFKAGGGDLWLIRHTPLPNRMPDTDALQANWDFVHRQMGEGKVAAAWAVGFGGVAEAVCKMAFGNGLGAELTLPEDELFRCALGSLVVQARELPDYPAAQRIGRVTDDGVLRFNDTDIPLADALEASFGPHARVFPNTVPCACELDPGVASQQPVATPRRPEPVETPLVYMPVFPGSNCDYDTAKAFRTAGAAVETGVFRNLTARDVLASIDAMEAALDRCQILALVGGFSSGDEPDGSGKFIANVLNNRKIADAVHRLLDRGGLILGICNGFQALVKSGLLPYGRLGCVTPASPTLFRNDINRHISQMVTTRVESVHSPWLDGCSIGDLHSIAVSHGEGKFVVDEQLARELFARGQVAFRYADPISGEATMDAPLNPNGSCYAIEGILSPDGQILGKMGHSERYEYNLMRNISGNRKQNIFQSAVNHFKTRER